MQVNKTIATTLLLFVVSLISTNIAAQELPPQEFHTAANQYLEDNVELAKNTLKKGLNKHPGNQYLEDLLKKIEEKEEEQQEQDQEQKQDQQNKDQGDKGNEEKQQDQQDGEDEGKEGENSKEGQDGEEKDQNQQQGQEGEENEEQEGEQQSQQEKEDENGEEKESKAGKAEEKKEGDEEGEPNPQSMTQQRFGEIDMSEEKAKMILEALKNEEIKYYQQMQKPSSMPKDNSKPDW